MSTALAPTVAARADRIAGAILVALALAFAVVTLSGTGSTNSTGGRLGGDFPEFYGAGEIVRTGDAAQLYDPARQAASQEGLFGDETGGYLDYAYPPVVAAAYAPLSALPYRTAYLVQVAAMALCLAIGIRSLRPVVPFVSDHPTLVFAAALVFFPMFRAVGGGQNTAVTFLALAVAWRSLRDDRELVAGIALGALLYKPQLAILVVIAPVLTWRWRVVGGIAVSAAALWLASALTMGIGWIGPFLDHGRSVPSGDGRVGGGGSISLVGTAHRFGADAQTWLVPLAFVASFAIGAACLFAWCRRSRGPNADLGLAFAVLVAGTAIAAPHVIFYDAGMLVIVGLMALRAPTGRMAIGLGAIVALSYLGALDGLLVNPLFFLALGTAVWSLAQTEVLRSATLRR